MSRITPIFIVGTNRSSTKWLSNILANHPDVAAVQTERTLGIVETNMFDSLRTKFPDLRRPDDFVGLIELWAATDFFKSTGIDRQLFYRLHPRPLSHFEIFAIFMNELATRKGVGFWLQKTDPWHAFDVVENFPQARFVVIERNMADTLRSTFYLETGGEGALSAKMILSHVLQVRILRKLRQTVGALSTTYERIRDEREAEITRLCRNLGLAYRPEMLEVPFRRNTSFRSKQQQQFAFSRMDRLKMKCLGQLGDWMPIPGLRALRAVLGTPDERITSGTFGQIRDEFDVH